MPKRLYRLLPFMIGLLLFIAVPALSAPLNAPHQQTTCEDLVTLATTTVGFACESIGRNQACYGNQLVDIEFNEGLGEGLVFNRSGDVVDLLSIRNLSTSPLNVSTGEWGVAIIKAQANLPDTLPGQNVTFLLFGDATLENATSDMRAVKLRTGIGGTECEEAPSGVLIQSPGGQQVTMNINGADLTLGSTVFVSAEENVSMKLSTLDGLAVMTALGETRLVPTGGEIGVRLGGEDGLEVAGAPSALRGFTQTQLPFVPLGLLDDPIVLPPSMNIPGQMGTGLPTPTSPNVAATSVSPNCVPRADWTSRYVIQQGETLSNIAGRGGIALNDLAAGNCITNPGLIYAGQILNVPFPIPTPRPRPTSTPTLTPTSNTTIIGPNLRADSNPIYYGTCTIIRWDVANISQVYFEGSPAVGSEARQVCPQATYTYTLTVIKLDGSQQNFQITIYVESLCGNSVCDPGESYATCPSDCPYPIG